MKKIIIILTVLFALGSKEASAQRITFYYYPTPNLYYNISTHDYIYYDPGVSVWVTVKSLPPGIVLTRTRYTVYYNGPQVWKENVAHKSKYKTKKSSIKKTNQKSKGRS